MLHSPHRRHAQASPHQSAQPGQGQGLAQHHTQYLARTPSHGPQGPEFPRALEDAHQYRVHHSHPADEHRQKRDSPGEALNVGQHLLLLGEIGGLGDREVGKALLDALAYPLGILGIPQFDQEGTHLARTPGEGLGFPEQHHSRAVLERRARLVDAHDAVGALVEPECVADLFTQVVGCCPSQDERSPSESRRPLCQPLSRHNLEVLDGEPIGLVAEDDEVGHALRGGEGINHTVHLFHPGQACEGRAHLLVHRAEDDVYRVCLGHQQVGSAAATERAVAGD